MATAFGKPHIVRFEVTLTPEGPDQAVLRVWWSWLALDTGLATEYMTETPIADMTAGFDQSTWDDSYDASWAQVASLYAGATTAAVNPVALP